MVKLQSSNGNIGALVLLGKPAAGKGTQGKALSAIPGFSFVSMGEIMRRAADTDKDIAKSVASGQLLDDDQILSQFAAHVQDVSNHMEYVNNNPPLLVVDGIPRTEEQAEGLLQILSVVAVVYLDCPENATLKRRVKQRSAAEGRPDDRLDIFEKRLEIFERHLEPILRQFGADLVYEVHGNDHPFKVHRELIEKITPPLQSFWESA